MPGSILLITARVLLPLLLLTFILTLLLLLLLLTFILTPPPSPLFPGGLQAAVPAEEIRARGQCLRFTTHAGLQRTRI